MKSWQVYILRCVDTTFYIGITKNLTKRIAAHNAGKGAKYTRSRKPVSLVWSGRLNSESAARKREAKMKRWTKREKEAFIRLALRKPISGLKAGDGFTT